jgi:hypothetical protein
MNHPGSPESSLAENRQLDRNRLAVMIGLLELGRGHIPERCEQAAAVVPRDTLEGRELDIPRALPGLPDDGSPRS